jgi:hypothetical protein
VNRVETERKKNPHDPAITETDPKIMTGSLHLYDNFWFLNMVI